MGAMARVRRATAKFLRLARPAPGMMIAAVSLAEGSVASPRRAAAGYEPRTLAARIRRERKAGEPHWHLASHEHATHQRAMQRPARRDP
jgi:hypothetical protein